MFYKLIISLFFFSTFLIPKIFGQNKEENKNDSSKVYQEIQSFSKKKGKFVSFLHGLLFKEIETGKGKSKKKKFTSKYQKSHVRYEGKIIRNINITTLDPFGFSAPDTAINVQNGFYRAGNRLHIKSQNLTIRNLLLIRKNTSYDSLLVKESERLIRSQKYVQEVFIYNISTGDDSVDVNIRVVDKWSIKPSFYVSPSKFGIKLTEENLLGTGHNFTNAYTWFHDKGMDAFSTMYLIPNIRNTYINASLTYDLDEFDNYNKSVSVDRSFYSTYARWAGGVYFDQQYRRDSIFQGDSTFLQLLYKFNTQDYWGGYSKELYKYSNDEYINDLIFTMRYKRINYINKPPGEIDLQKIYSSEDFYLGGIALSQREYIQDKYIFNYGFIEDVPAGKVIGITGGYQVKNSIGRMYAGARFSIGNYTDLGYLSSSLEIGTFLRSSKLEQSVLSVRMNYFTKLIEIGQWKFRQFVKPQLILGLNRFEYELLNIDRDNGIRGFESKTTTGTKKFLFTLQTQSYAPWNLAGFRFGPYLILAFGMLGVEEQGFKNSKLFSQYGLGVLIKNDFLVFSNFQLSLSYYPDIPGDGSDIFKMNQDKTSNLGFMDFQLGKPDIVPYR